MAPCIYIVSLTEHRIDELIADYMEDAIDLNGGPFCVRRLPDSSELLEELDSILFVTNGVMNDMVSQDGSTESVLGCMKKMKSFYFIDDHTTWVPSKLDYPLCTLVSQFTVDGIKGYHPKMDYALNEFKYFPISNLALFMNPYTNTGDYEFVYWGHMKRERMNMYKTYIPNDPSTLIIGEKEWKQHFPAITLVPYERDMDELYKLIAKGKKTVVFGDKFHNGVNIPWRIYEAEKCGVSVTIDKDLLGNREVPRHSGEELGMMLLELCGIEATEELGEVSTESWRTTVVDELIPLEECSSNTLDYKMSEELKATMARASIMSSRPTINTQQDHLDTDIDSILSQRATLYGTYEGGVDCRADMLRALNTKYMETHDGDELPMDLLVIFGDLVLKMMRIASDPTHLDSYIDLAGYAKLIKEMKCDI